MLRAAASRRGSPLPIFPCELEKHSRSAHGRTPEEPLAQCFLKVQWKTLHRDGAGSWNSTFTVSNHFVMQHVPFFQVARTVLAPVTYNLIMS